MQSEILYVKLIVAAPLHVGCAEVYEPTSFVIDSEQQELVHFDTGRFIDLLDEAALQKLSAICRAGTPRSIVELMRFIRDQARDTGIDGNRIPVCKGLVEHYAGTLGMNLNDHRKVNNEINRFQIMRTAFDPLSGEVYIPGSAVKGAIRTAVLNLRKDQVRGHRYRYSRDLQQGILQYDFRHLESDPFRLVKVSDFFPAGPVRRRVVYAVDKKKRPNRFESRAPYQIIEVVEQGAAFVGSITVLQPLKRGIVRQPLSAGEITEALRVFYGREKDREDRELQYIGVPAVKLETNGSRFPLRIGRHSGAECVTVEGHRSIKIMQGKGQKPKSEDAATTIWLTADSSKPNNNAALRPFGWVLCELLDEESWVALRERLLEDLRQREAKARERLAGREAEQQAARARGGKEASQRAEPPRAAADPAAVRRRQLDAFVQALPSSAALPGQAAGIIEKIRGFEDDELRRACLAELRKRYKDQIKKARRNKKQWAEAFVAMCEEAGV